MLSGNGRHRRPRQAPALLVAAGVTGSAIAIPLLGATGASAASGTTWDQVAECESGGSWSADTGNGRYGGLQISQGDWENHGGLDYATSPDQASRSQQIAVAERILDDQGVGAWSTCGLLHNLDGDSASADVDTGVAGDSSSSGDSSGSSDSSDNSTKSSDSSDSATSSDSSGSSDSSPRASGGSTKADADAGDSSESSDSDRAGGAQGSDSSVEADAKSGDSDNSTPGDTPSTSGDADAGTGRHRGASAEEGVHTDVADSRGDASTGRHASRGGDASREAVDGSYTVRPGDSLTAIADSLELSGGWRELYAENEGTVGTDPDLILPGQTLEVGAETGEK
ncbi:transglycosylase family protein [Streptomyces neyagawaensis]|uniref:LysM peptidoglycan-binding domain-containing protein n=1 Tax=Streptomyces neyagawaensis TaxID=42238 RepID=UPI0006E35932|nr:transglycosylase family protein [Streptomyces neyagawaensis]MCL6733046.1 LysM peptidoglycan-binding domain-containing protein [Streptomyces neyagawaensis]MDE1684907.1 transglycosylase family protein [Streptomyces neyagawaensis]